MGGRAVEGTGLENRQGCKPLVGSNPTPSANSYEKLPSLGSIIKKSIKHSINCLTTKLAGWRQRETDLGTQWKATGPGLVSIRLDTGEVPDSFCGNDIIHDNASDRRAPMSDTPGILSTTSG